MLELAPDFASKVHIRTRTPCAVHLMLCSLGERLGGGMVAGWIAVVIA